MSTSLCQLVYVIFVYNEILITSTMNPAVQTETAFYVMNRNILLLTSFCHGIATDPVANFL